MEDILFDRLGEKLKDILVFRNPRRRKKMLDELTHFPKDPQYKHNRLHEYKAFKEFSEANSSFDFDVIARTDACQVLTKITKL